MKKVNWSSRAGCVALIALVCALLAACDSRVERTETYTDNRGATWNCTYVDDATTGATVKHRCERAK